MTAFPLGLFRTVHPKSTPRLCIAKKNITDSYLLYNPGNDTFNTINIPFATNKTLLYYFQHVGLDIGTVFLRDQLLSSPNDLRNFKYLQPANHRYPLMLFSQPTAWYNIYDVEMTGLPGDAPVLPAIMSNYPAADLTDQLIINVTISTDLDEDEVTLAIQSGSINAMPAADGDIASVAMANEDSDLFGFYSVVKPTAITDSGITVTAEDYQLRSAAFYNNNDITGISLLYDVSYSLDESDPVWVANGHGFGVFVVTFESYDGEFMFHDAISDVQSTAIKGWQDFGDTHSYRTETYSVSGSRTVDGYHDNDGGSFTLATEMCGNTLPYRYTDVSSATASVYFEIKNEYPAWDYKFLIEIDYGRDFNFLRCEQGYTVALSNYRSTSDYTLNKSHNVTGPAGGGVPVGTATKYLTDLRSANDDLSFVGSIYINNVPKMELIFYDIASALSRDTINDDLNDALPDTSVPSIVETLVFRSSRILYADLRYELFIYETYELSRTLSGAGSLSGEYLYPGSVSFAIKLKCSKNGVVTTLHEQNFGSRVINGVQFGRAMLFDSPFSHLSDFSETQTGQDTTLLCPPETFEHRVTSYSVGTSKNDVDNDNNLGPLNPCAMPYKYHALSALSALDGYAGDLDSAPDPLKHIASQMEYNAPYRYTYASFDPLSKLTSFVPYSRINNAMHNVKNEGSSSAGYIVSSAACTGDHYVAYFKTIPLTINSVAISETYHAILNGQLIDPASNSKNIPPTSDASATFTL